MGNEIEASSAYYKKIIVFPSKNGENANVKLPSNVEVEVLNKNAGSKWKLLLSNFGLICTVFYLDLVKNSDKAGVLKRFRYNLSLLLQTLALSELLEKKIKEDKEEKQFVSFWMDEWALCLSILKYKKKIRSFVFRVHQHDLYNESDPSKYIPFRFFNIKMTSAIFPDSNRGVNFLKALNFYPEKMKVGHLGVTDKGTNPFDPSVYTIVSCSGLVARKRVQLIADSLMLVDVPLKWIHFGKYGDSPQSFEELKAKCEKLPPNITCELKGDVPYNELIRFYQSTPVSLFMTLTRAEGLPVSIIEATSFGVPVLATDVMGIPDVVSKDSGILIEPETKKEDIATIIKAFKNSEKNTPGYRKKVKEFWSKSFNSETNYFNFNTYINSLN